MCHCEIKLPGEEKKTGYLQRNGSRKVEFSSTDASLKWNKHLKRAEFYKQLKHP